MKAKKRVLGKSPIGKTVHASTTPLGDSVGAQELAVFVAQFHKDPMFRVGLKLAKAKAQRNYSPELGRLRYKAFLRKMARQYAIDIRRMPGKKGNKLFPLCDLESLARDYEHEFRVNWALGMWEPLLPKKLQKAASKKANHEAMNHVGTQPVKEIVITQADYNKAFPPHSAPKKTAKKASKKRGPKKAKAATGKVNAYGMTYARWKAAAGPNVEAKHARKAWKNGEDPSEYRT